MNFIPLTIETKNIWDTFLNPFPYKNSSYQFTNLYLWRKFNNTMYFASENHLFIKKGIEDPYFMAPVYRDVLYAREAYEMLFAHMDQYGHEKVIRDVEKSQLEDLKKLPFTFTYELHRDQQEYIYSVDHLRTYQGKALHKKKNHFNQFIRNHDYTLKYIEDSVKECIELAEKWFEESEYSPQLYHELLGIRDLLENRTSFNLKGISVFIDGVCQGFTILEVIQDEVILNHIEKAQKTFNGLYAFLVKTALEEFGDGILYTNREQDLGIPGLRKSKESYMPLFLEEKYIVRFT